jgi:hypothetical protein
LRSLAFSSRIPLLKQFFARNTFLKNTRKSSVRLIDLKKTRAFLNFTFARQNLLFQINAPVQNVLSARPFHKPQKSRLFSKILFSAVSRVRYVQALLILYAVF